MVNALEYDNSAFYYFAITLLVIYALPASYYALSEIFMAFFSSGTTGSQARNKNEKEKANQLKKQSTGLTRLNHLGFIVNFVVLVFAWLLIYYLFTLVSSDGEVQSFDPFTILGIEQNTPMNEIKKAYRKLSLKYHPDKNIGDKFAEEMFMKIAKAYEALTDPIAMKNFQEFGNPDGKQALEVSIGLPKLLLDNSKVVLVIYLIFMVVIIPLVVGLWYTNSKRYGDKNILYDTYKAFYNYLEESHRMLHYPELLATSAEFRGLYEASSANTTVKSTWQSMLPQLLQDKVMMKPKFDHPKVLRSNILLHCHLNRLTKQLTPQEQQDLHTMLLKSTDLIEGLIEIAQNRKWLDAAISGITFSQCMMQAMWKNADPLSQLPNLTTNERVKAIKTMYPHIHTLTDYLLLTNEEKIKPLTALLTKEEQQELLDTCELFPLMALDSKLFVEEDEEEEDGNTKKTLKQTEEEDISTNKTTLLSTFHSNQDIYEQDLVTLRIKLTRQSFSSTSTKKTKANYVYAPYSPFVGVENWWIVLTDKPITTTNTSLTTTNTLDSLRKKIGNEINIFAFEKISSSELSLTHEIRFLAPPRVGKYEYTLHIYCDAYVGLDMVQSIPFVVQPASALPEYQPHPEDVELDNEPTLFEQLMAPDAEDSSDDEDEDETEGQDVKSKGRVVVEDVDSEEDNE